MHVLAWGDWNPDWVDELQPGEKRAALLGLMRQVLERYRDREHMVYWDIVNEAICDNILLTPAKQNCLGSELLKGGEYSSWYPDVPDYMDAAFALARQILGPSKVLCCNNDYLSDLYRSLALSLAHYLSVSVSVYVSICLLPDCLPACICLRVCLSNVPACLSV
jgi:GH35 family endo-1,4-beta-xylanase